MREASKIAQKSDSMNGFTQSTIVVKGAAESIL
jgi:hypothetical protein